MLMTGLCSWTELYSLCQLPRAAATHDREKKGGIRQRWINMGKTECKDKFNGLEKVREDNNRARHEKQRESGRVKCCD